MQSLACRLFIVKRKEGLERGKAHGQKKSDRGYPLAGKKISFPEHRVETFAKAERKTKSQQEGLF